MVQKEKQKKLKIQVEKIINLYGINKKNANLRVFESKKISTSGLIKIPFNMHLNPFIKGRKNKGSLAMRKKSINIKNKFLTSYNELRANIPHELMAHIPHELVAHIPHEPVAMVPLESEANDQREQLLFEIYNNQMELMADP